MGRDVGILVKLGAIPVVPTRRSSDLVPKPEGTPTVRTVVPAVLGANAVLALTLSPGLKTAGLPTIDPTPGGPLVTGTLTVKPPRTACWLWKFKKVGSSIAGTMLSGAS